MDALAYETGSGLAAALRRKKISSAELTRHFLDRIERHNPSLNAVVTLNPAALGEAEEADRRLARGEEPPPLLGVPMTVKDTFETAGLLTTAGARDLASYVPASDATAVARLRAAGAVILGKTNTPAYAGDLQTYNRLFGTTNNPWDLSRSPGGSSGGAAAALAAGLTPLELGSDIGGSIRTPSAWSGVFGHKPSFGIVPGLGHRSGLPGTTPEPDIAAYGPMARSAEDLSLLLRILAGPPESAARGWKLELPPARHDDLSSFRVAAWLDEPGFATDESLLEVFQRAIATLRKEGVAVDEEARPGFSFTSARDSFEALLFSGLSGTLPGKFYASCQERVRFAGAEDRSPALRFARASVLSHREWLIEDIKRQEMRAAWRDFFQRFDILLCPATVLPAIRHDQEKGLTERTVEVNGEIRPYLDLFSWAGVIGVSYLPAASVPVGRTSSGLPAGLQVVSGYLEDATALGFAARLSKLLGGFSPPPGFAG